ncbi:hypothetical protein KKH43_02860 [Patescibacteria group bacterium]|nr:hypothetical protein [Patescibacteria group bacterium]
MSPTGETFYPPGPEPDFETGVDEQELRRQVEIDQIVENFYSRFAQNLQESLGLNMAELYGPDLSPEEKHEIITSIEAKLPTTYFQIEGLVTLDPDVIKRANDAIKERVRMFLSELRESIPYEPAEEQAPEEKSDPQQEEPQQETEVLENEIQAVLDDFDTDPLQAVLSSGDGFSYDSNREELDFWETTWFVNRLRFSARSIATIILLKNNLSNRQPNELAVLTEKLTERIATLADTLELKAKEYKKSEIQKVVDTFNENPTKYFDIAKIASIDSRPTLKEKMAGLKYIKSTSFFAASDLIKELNVPKALSFSAQERLMEEFDKTFFEPKKQEILAEEAESYLAAFDADTENLTKKLLLNGLDLANLEMKPASKQREIINAARGYADDAGSAYVMRENIPSTGGLGVFIAKEVAQKIRDYLDSLEDRITAKEEAKRKAQEQSADTEKRKKAEARKKKREEEAKKRRGEEQKKREESKTEEHEQEFDEATAVNAGRALAFNKISEIRATLGIKPYEAYEDISKNKNGVKQLKSLHREILKAAGKEWHVDKTQALPPELKTVYNAAFQICSSAAAEIAKYF